MRSPAPKNAPTMYTMARSFRCVLVTGALGCIGSAVVQRWTAAHPETRFVVYDALTYAGSLSHVPEPWPPNLEFVYGSVTDAGAFGYALSTHRPDAVVHLAAETHVDSSFMNSIEFSRVNYVGTHTLLECVRRHVAEGGDLRVFLHMSTDEVTGSADDDAAPCREDALLKPTSPYAASKAAAEMMCAAYRCSFRLPVIIARCNNAVGRNQHPEKLVPAAVTRILAGRRVPIHGDGLARRTFIDVRDISDALEVMLTRGEIGATYNISTDHEYTVLEVVGRVLAKLRPGERLEDWVEHVGDRAFNDRRYLIDGAALRALGWRDRVPFDAALDDVITRWRSS